MPSLLVLSWLLAEWTFTPLQPECPIKIQQSDRASQSCRVGALLEHGPRTDKRVAITFDACSAGQYLFDEEVYRALEEMRVKSTIFVGGEWAERNPKLARRMAGNPLVEIASHSYHHPHLPTMTERQLWEEMRRGQYALWHVTGVFPRLMRAPFGEIDERVLWVSRELGLKMVQYDLPSGDPDPHLKPDKIVSWVVEQTKPGSIVVMHINRNGVHTAETFPEIVYQLRARGYEMVTVSDLLGLDSEFTDGASCIADEPHAYSSVEWTQQVEARR